MKTKLTIPARLFLIIFIIFQLLGVKCLANIAEPISTANHNSRFSLRLGYGTANIFDTLLPANNYTYLTGLTLGINYDFDFKLLHFKCISFVGRKYF
ncbi:hypothetical protein ACFL52_05225 [Candidatus Margulisiibacteriota bacterium]